jgi:DNA-directed RNA polymerase subunit RPC12/RpoP
MTKKVDFGMRCTKCGHKISDRILGGENGSRIEKSGVCQKCHKEHYGYLGLALQSGNHQYKMLFETSNQIGVLPILRVIEGENNG